MQTAAVCLPSPQILAAKVSRPFSSSQSPQFPEFPCKTLLSSGSSNGLYGQCVVIPATGRRLKLEEKTFGGRILAKQNGEANGNGERATKKKIFGKIDKLFVDSAKGFRGSGYKQSIKSRSFQGDEGEAGDWIQMEGCWVLKPTVKESVAVVHFIGGAFVGAAPELTYRLFLQTLAERGVTIIATPYPTSFEHFEIADEAQSGFERCLRALNNGQVGRLPVYGVGHSLGALTQVIIASKNPKDADSKDAIERQGNVLLSYNNKEVTDSIPHLLPSTVVPSSLLAKLFVPIIKLRIKSSVVFQRVDFAWRILQKLNFPFFKEILPLLDQLSPLIQDVIDGKINFDPSPAETDELAKAYYGVKPSLLVKFSSDSIDESIHLQEILRLSSNLTASDIEIRTLSGTHSRPIQQVFEEDSPDKASDGNPNFLVEAARNVRQSVAQSVCRKFREGIEEDIESLVDEIAPFIGASRRPIGAGPIEVKSPWVGNLKKIPETVDGV